MKKLFLICVLFAIIGVDDAFTENKMVIHFKDGRDDVSYNINDIEKITYISTSQPCDFYENFKNTTIDGTPT